MTSLVKANKYDAELFWGLRNDAEARKQFSNTEIIPWKDHLRWFKNALSDRKHKLFTVRFDKDKIGYVRFERKKVGNFVSICLAPWMRGRGIGTEALKLACKKIKRPIYAEIKERNFLSQNAFKRAGFKLKTGDDECETLTYVLLR